MSARPLPSTPLGAGVIRRDDALSDGRELFYYDDADTTLPPERRADEREAAPRPATASMRRDALSGEWISVAAARQNRAFLPPAHLDPLAPQTPSNPSEVPSHYDVAVFENRSPSFGPGLGEGSGAEASVALHDLHAEREAVGRCEVVCFAPESEGAFGTLPTSRARTVIEAWADRTRALSALPGVRQVFPFENRGEQIGVTLHHPHGQIYAYPYVTPRTATMLAAIEREGPDLFARLVEAEAAGPRVVLRGSRWIAYVPFAARWPIEVHVTPLRHVADLSETSDDERAELAVLYPRVLRALDALYDSPTPYIAAWHQAPVDAGRDRLRLHLQLTSPRRAADRLKYLAGSEAAMGAWVADIAPEDAAARLRDALAVADERWGGAVEGGTDASALARTEADA